MSHTFHPAAEAEYLEAVAFYESRQSGLGASFMASFDEAVARLTRAPRRYPVVKKPDIRRIALERFPFHVIYRNGPADIQILAVAHHRRRPIYWRDRGQ